MVIDEGEGEGTSEEGSGTPEAEFEAMNSYTYHNKDTSLNC